MRLAFLSDWESPDATYRRHCWMTPGRRGIWGGLAATRACWRADYVVVHGGFPARRYHLLPPGRTLWFRHEPAAIAPHWPRRLTWTAWLAPPAFLQSFEKGAVPMVATWWIDMDYDTLSALRPPAKTLPLSAIVSAKATVPGHGQRLALVGVLAARYPDAVDVFGRGLATHGFGPAYRGEVGRVSGSPLGRPCKYDGLRDYRYSLCVENSRERNYYTEKIVDAWLSWTVPLYWGCPNLSDYYPRQSFIEIDIHAPDAADQIVRRSREPVDRLTLEAIGEARRLALDRYSTWGTLGNVLGKWGC